MNAFDIFHRTTTKGPTQGTADAVDSIGSGPTTCTAVSRIRYDTAETHAIIILYLLIRTHYRYYSFPKPSSDHVVEISHDAAVYLFPFPHVCLTFRPPLSHFFCCETCETSLL